MIPSRYPELLPLSPREGGLGGEVCARIAGKFRKAVASS